MAVTRLLVGMIVSVELSLSFMFCDSASAVCNSSKQLYIVDVASADIKYMYIPWYAVRTKRILARVTLKSSPKIHLDQSIGLFLGGFPTQEKTNGLV